MQRVQFTNTNFEAGDIIKRKFDGFLADLA